MESREIKDGPQQRKVGQISFKISIPGACQPRRDSLSGKNLFVEFDVLRNDQIGAVA